MTNPQAGREQEYADWYAGQHLGDMIQVPSVTQAKLHTASDERPYKWRHCALYDLAGDPAEAMAQVFEQGKAGKIAPSTAGDSASRLLAIATPLAARRGDKPADPDNDLFFVLTNPTEGQEAEYNRWYDEQHIDDVLAIPGFVGMQRFRLSSPPGMPAPYWGYVAFYEIDRTKTAEAFAGLDAARGTDRMPMSPALNRADNEVALYRPVKTRVKADAEAAGAK
jgi:hypothetical protein